jgi:RimJ/RimL family protein N-acetyltransferase
MQPFDRLTLTTERLLLRPLCADDADALFRMHADPLTMRYMSTPPWSSRAQADELIAKDLVALPAGQHLRLGLTEHGGSTVLGTCSLFAFNESCRRAEVGYALARPAWGAGLMNEALRALLVYAFGELRLNRIEADIDPRNSASAKSLERLGFVREGLLRERWIVAGEVSDTALYGLLQRDWLAAAATNETRLPPP